jgi:hypothetical protein
MRTKPPPPCHRRASHAPHSSTLGVKSMEWQPFRLTNPQGWQTVAGGRSAAETPGRLWSIFTTPQGWQSSATPAGLIRSFGRRPGGIAVLNPRLLSGKPPACSGSGEKANKTLEPPAAGPSVC